MINNELYTKIQFLKSLETAKDKLLQEISEDYFKETGIKYQPEDIPEILASIKPSESTFDCDIPYFDYTHMGCMELGIQYQNGDRLSSYLSESDAGTYQTGAVYYNEEQSPIDICMAEIKKGELARVNHKEDDNRDIDIYVWDDPFTEDYTYKKTIPFQDIHEALQSVDISEIDYEE